MVTLITLVNLAIAQGNYSLHKKLANNTSNINANRISSVNASPSPLMEEPFQSPDSWKQNFSYPSYIYFNLIRADNQKTQTSLKGSNSYQELSTISLGLYQGVRYSFYHQEIELFLGLVPNFESLATKSTHPPLYSLKSQNSLSLPVGLRYGVNIYSQIKLYTEISKGWIFGGFAQDYFSLGAGLAWKDYYLQSNYYSYHLNKDKFQGWSLSAGITF